MSRTIRLTRIHALNWYGYKDSIAVEGNLLLAGVTGSGKSILMDLIQLVLIGDQRLVRFNQSATGDRSDRSLKGYCLGDTKHEENGVTQYMRSSAISYIALEFTWPNGKRVETWGLRIEFASAAEAQGKVSPFFVPSALERSQFLDAEKRPLDLPAFRALAESFTARDGTSGRVYNEGLEAYLRDMAQPTHLNFDRGVLRALLPTAMSFTFLRSFNEFARQFILPADKLDVADVTSSYRTFLAYERDLTELNDQFQRLASIREIFQKWSDLERDASLSRYLAAQLRHEASMESLQQEQARLLDLQKRCAAEEARLAELATCIPEHQARIDGLKASINETPEGRLYNDLKSRNATLAKRIADLSGIGSSLADALANRVRNARSWLADLRALPLDLESAPIQAFEHALMLVERAGPASATETLPALAEAAKAAAASISKAAAPTQRRLIEIRAQLGELRDQITLLKLGKLPGGNSRLLDVLNSQLPHRGSELPAQPLCKLCEVTDERWRPAIEVAFTRKFAVVVAVEHYDQAEKLYHGLRESELGGGSRESLINPTRALQLRKPVQSGSLAEKLQTQHPVAAAIISHLFGDLACVESREALRTHDFAILPDGFMTRGAFVERSRFYDGNPFVGKRGLEQQRAFKERLVADLESEERRLQPLERALKSIADGWRDHFDVPPSLYTDLARTQELPRLTEELEQNIAKLKTIDRARFDEMARDLAVLDTQLRQFEEERRQLDRSEQRAELRLVQSRVEALRRDSQKLHDQFIAIRDAKDISRWVKRLEQLRAEMLAEFPAKDIAANRFENRAHKCEVDATEAWGTLRSQRRELAIAHPKFGDLPIEANNNQAHDKQLAKLDESEIPDYQAKAKRERKNWESLFRTQILEKLHNALNDVLNNLTLLNTSLRKRPIGNNTYELRYHKNPDYKVYHQLLEASALARTDDLFFASADQQLRLAVDDFLKTLTEQPDSIKAASLLDYRHYYDYDMEVIEPDGRKTSVDKHSGKFSGGENQSPYFIAILASYYRAYRRYTARRNDATLGIVPIDEAFSKLSGERIKDCITAVKAFDLQGVFSMSTGNIPYAFEHCDWLVVVSKDERRVGKRLEIRNIPVSLARDSEDARRMMHD